MQLTLNRPYIEERNGGLYITGKRVSLDSIVYCYKEGQSPESIQRSFPVLGLEDVYAAITFYLANREDVEAYLEEADRLAETMLRESNARNRDVIERVWGDATSNS